ncbi:hypothetical protein L195_g027037, partial [Trifolium pratense]
MKVWAVQVASICGCVLGALFTSFSLLLVSFHIRLE